MRGAWLGVSVAAAALALTGCTVTYTPDKGANSPPPRGLRQVPEITSNFGSGVSYCLSPPGSGIRVFAVGTPGLKEYAFTTLDVRDRRAPDPWACP